MTESIRPTRRTIISRAHHGQTLIIAIAILFVLLILGGIFVAQIARNLAAAGRSRETQNAQSFAEAGINYCSNQMETSEDGADWRPVPTPPLGTPADPMGLTDPDYQWLAQGFTRQFFPGGRSLIRVTYDPHPDDPRSQMIAIEAVGRPGELAQGNDPTIFVQNGNPPRLRREQIAYKQIGLTDYLMWVTNKDHRDAEAFIGVPALGADLAMTFGDPSIAQHPNGMNNGELYIGGGLRVNGNLRLGGFSFFYFSSRGTNQNGNPSVSPEALLASGKISLLPTINLDNGGGPRNNLLDNNDLQVFVNQPMTNPSINFAIRASEDARFSTISSVIRDGSSGSDVNGYGRGVPYLDAPRWDTYTNDSGVLRFRALTRDSGFWVNSTYNTGFAGYGRGLYINNPGDLQPETTASGQTGSYSLRADWLDPKAGFSQSAWNGPFYRPPGVVVELLGNRIRLTRSDGRAFTKPDGTSINGGPTAGSGGNVIEIPLTDFERANYQFPDGSIYVLPILSKDGDLANDNNKPFTDKHSYGVNFVIMAEGNVRVKGVYGAITDPADTSEDATHPKLGRVHLTIVSGGTAYIDGNIVKGDGYRNGSGVHLERGSTCAIMAKDYVCVNTTQFMAPQNQTNAWSQFSPDLDIFSTEIGQARTSYDTSFSWGVDPGSYQTGGGNSPIFLMLRHAAVGTESSHLATINLLINPGLGGNSLYQFGSAGLPPETYPLGEKLVNGLPIDDPAQVTPRFEQKAFLLPGGVNSFATLPGFDNLFRFQIDPNAAALFGSGGQTDYALAGAMVTPLDIRIEALLYAQEKSFFVIPGYPFNTDPNDTRIGYSLRAGVRTSYSNVDSAADRIMKDMGPYYNEPMDVRITICGAIAQNYTASSGDQAAWLSKWGYIPEIYGSTDDPAKTAVYIPDDHRYAHDSTSAAVTYNPAEDRGTANNPTDYRTPLEKQQHISRGLRFEYDPAFAMPYQHPTDAGLLTSTPMQREQRALRFIERQVMDSNGNIINTYRQILPSIPRLPVCPGLLYFGEGDRPVG